MRAGGALLCLLFPAIALAQQIQHRRPHRSGLWGELGLVGPGHVRVSCSNCTDVVTGSGNTSYLRIGGTVSDHVLIGGEIFTLLNRGFGFTSADTATTTETGIAAIVVLWFPTTNGFFVKGGVGAAVGEFTVRSSATTEADTSTGGGIGLTFGAGWDFPLSRKFAITANLGVYVTAVGDVVLPSRRVDDVIATMYAAALGFTFR